MTTAYVSTSKEEGIGTITWHRPGVKNAYDLAFMKELNGALREMIGDADVKAVLMTGKDDFSSGADIKTLAAMKDGQEMGEFCRYCNQTLDMIAYYGVEHAEELIVTKPFIAAIDGYCVGGGLEIALACDLRYATREAKFGFPEITLGLLPGTGGIARLCQIVGYGRAFETVTTGQEINPEKAYSFGLVNGVYDNKEEMLADLHDKLATWYAQGPPLALSEAKRCVQESYRMPLDKAIAYASARQKILANTFDKREGCQAFLEKREPDFRGE